MDEEIERDASFLPLPYFATDETASMVRGRASLLMQWMLRGIRHHVNVPYDSMNLFDRYVSLNRDLMDNGSFLTLDKVIIGCTILGFTINGGNLPLDELRNRFGKTPAGQAELRRWSRTIADAENIKNVQPIRMHLFVNHFVSLLDLELTQNLKASVKKVATEKAVTLYANVIALTEFRPSVLAASAVLLTVKFLAPRRFGDARMKVRDICFNLGIDPDKVETCLYCMSVHASSAVLGI